MTPLLPRARVVKQIARYGGDILTHAAMQGTKNFPHHGQTSVFAHSVAVTYLCVALALRLRLQNARADFALSPIEENAILRHMFPLTLIPPRCREGWLVCLADKICAVCELAAPAYLRLAAPMAERRALKAPPQEGGASSSFHA